MTKKILFPLLLAALFSGTMQAQNIEWKTIEQAAKTDSKSNTKLYFVDFYTSWCGWCKKMDRETFTNPIVAKILNTYYIPVKFDAEGNLIEGGDMPAADDALQPAEDGAQPEMPEEMPAEDVPAAEQPAE